MSDAASRPTIVAALLRHGRLAMKELRETLRDRRTIITLLLMPVLVYPLLSMAFQRFLVAGVRNHGGSTYKIAVPRPDVAETFAQYLKTSPLLDQDGKPIPFECKVTDSSLTDAVAYTDAVLAVDLRMQEQLPVMVIYYRGDYESRYFARELETRLLTSNVNALQSRLAENKIPYYLPSYVFPRLVPTATSGASPLATLVPLILILMTITGAVYPAIDLTAGERERGTLETLIAAPVPRISLLLAKYVAVVTVALFTATMNLLAMTATVQLSGLGPLLFGREGLSITTVIHVFGLLVLFAAFFSAILLSITAFARSFKEAQAYLIPLMLMSIAPGLLSMTPEVVLTPGLAAVPLVNMVLLARDVFVGDVNPALASIALVTTTFYAIAAVALAARIFGTDAILYGSHRSWSDLFERPSQISTTLTIGAAFTCVAVLFPGQFLVGGLLARFKDVPLATRLVIMAVASVLLFVGVPWLAARLYRVSVRSGFRLRMPHPVLVVAGLALGASMWPLAIWSLQWGARIGLATLTNEQLQGLDQS